MKFGPISARHKHTNIPTYTYVDIPFPPSTIHPSIFPFLHPVMSSCSQVVKMATKRKGKEGKKEKKDSPARQRSAADRSVVT